jgi:hypothetical protein
MFLEGQSTNIDVIINLENNKETVVFKKLPLIVDPDKDQYSVIPDFKSAASFTQYLPANNSLKLNPTSWDIGTHRV